MKINNLLCDLQQFQSFHKKHDLDLREKWFYDSLKYAKRVMIEFFSREVIKIEYAFSLM